MKKGDYIIANVTIRGQCKKDRRYKIQGIIEKGYEYECFGFFIKYDEEAYYIIHNNRWAISNSSNFKYDYHYNRKLKFKKINKRKI